MFGCSSEMELRLSYNAGMVDGIMMAADVVAGCENNHGCKRRMIERIRSVAQAVGAERTNTLMHLILNRPPP